MMLKATESKRIWNWLIARIASFLNWQPSVALVLLSFAQFLTPFQFCILNDDSVMFYAPLHVRECWKEQRHAIYPLVRATLAKP